MEIQILLETHRQKIPLSFQFNRMVNAGYVGRDQEEVRRHIQELAKKGIPSPNTTPTLYPVICRTLVTENEIEVYGEETSGEVEYVLLVQDESRVFVGLGSDHTDRHLEESDIPRAKQICPNVLSQKVWPLKEVLGHWDDLLIRSRVRTNGKEVLYQEDRLSAILPPDALMNFVRKTIRMPLKEMIIYSGTIGTLTGGFVFGDRFEAELIDENLGRKLELSYSIHPLRYLRVG